MFIAIKNKRSGLRRILTCYSITWRSSGARNQMVRSYKHVAALH